MKRATVFVLVALALGLSIHAHARELRRPVHLKDGKNVVASTGEVLDFQLTAERDEGGNVLVKFVVPRDSSLQKASYLRLEIRDDKRIVLWSQLDWRKGDDGATTAAFQIHDSLAKGASIGIAYDARPNDLGMYSYQVPIVEYIKDRNPKPN